jgi:lipoprotein-anchoring transpeptidase ErfK/SrfK
MVIVLSAATWAGAQQPAPSKGLALQVALDRAGFSPGEIDGSSGANTRRALEAFCQARRVTCRIAAAVDKALHADGADPTTSYTITDQDTAGPFAPEIPTDMEAQAQLPALSYTSVLEMLGERFHAAPALLKQLNPSAAFTAGESIVVPNVAHEPPTVAASRVVVSRSRSSLTVLDARGRVLFFAPVTSGSAHDPLPLGQWAVTAVLHNPPFNYNPALFWDADPTDAKVKLPPGPNGPVGTVWIDLSKKNYGLHGTAEPAAIARTTSHGCVRMTNWDAETVASLVRKGTPVLFER